MVPTASKPHRGRIQAQGGGTEKSVKWELDDAPTTEMLADSLDDLWNHLTSTEQKLRQTCYDKAKKYLSSRTTTLNARLQKSFTNPTIKGGIRIDIEILAGDVIVAA